MTGDRSLSDRRQVLEEQLEQVGIDLDDLAGQEAVGDLDPGDAERLRTTYRNERRRLESQLSELIDGDEPVPAGRDRRRVAGGVALLVVGFVAVTMVLMATVRDRQPGELATGGIAGEVASGAIDLSEVTNEEMEAVIAANPEVTGMRLALARRYFEEGAFDQALPHFMTILEDQDPDNAEALASVGWMTHLSGRSDVAAGFVERALDISPEYVQAHWYLANIRFHGLEDEAGAVEPLQRLLEYDSLPDEVRTEATALLDRALAARDGS